MEKVGLTYCVILKPELIIVFWRNETVAALLNIIILLLRMMEIMIIKIKLLGW